MKILFIVTQSEMGGAQRYVFEIAQYLLSQGEEVLVAAGEGDGELISKLKSPAVPAQQISKPQLKTQNLKHLKRAPGPFKSLFSVIEIYNLLKRENPNVLFLCSTTAGILGSIAGWLYKALTVFSCSLGKASKLAFLSLRFKNKKVAEPSIPVWEQWANPKLLILYRIGGWAFRDPRPLWQIKCLIWLEKFTARFKDRIIVNCEVDREMALRYKICPANKIVKIYNGLDVKSLEFLPKEKAKNLLNSSFPVAEQVRYGAGKIQDSGKIVGCVANFYKTKGLECLIKAARLLNSKSYIPVWEQWANSKFFIIGDGKLRPKLEHLIKKNHLENTVFLIGKITDAYRYLKAFDVFVLPSVKEGFPWIILEAMAAQVPIVATAVGAVPEIIENNTEGLLTEPKNSHQLAEKIFWLLSHPKEAEELGVNARKKVEREFTLRKMAEKTEALVVGL